MFVIIAKLNIYNENYKNIISKSLNAIDSMAFAV